MRSTGSRLTSFLLFPAPSSAVLQQIAVEAEPCHDEAVAAPDEAGYLSASQAAAA
jgi:hypothetical protein